MRKLEFETIFGQLPNESNSYQVAADSSSANGVKILCSDLVRGYEHAFIQQCGKYANKQILGQFRLITTIYTDKEAFDLGTSIKTILNCLQIVKAVADKRKCSEVIVRKIVDIRHPRIEFVLDEVEHPMDIAALSDFLNRESVQQANDGKL